MEKGSPIYTSNCGMAGNYVSGNIKILVVIDKILTHLAEAYQVFIC